ncbi:Pnap_2097 family protein [Paraburkholderia silvatlantica]|uniref:Biosynthetic protein (TIGR04099 family) n=1 Tax=Paraburkholderia silvatlantica TaxID=321895 RepID=A0A2U1A774_9BURK|nr:Pnap_2097 family protein [Paraburkholderia silvatlantica]MBB2931426.1 putative biosynthetic protein (TIGR04099 family) [Paraburkholderia silvatlantica]PVY27907.1 putative biosynthetic protein (TIGR04099 family) [Paraburkholderia silvatlantica]PXW34754.1 putative biosynthetic protein (TIGR04099 family) [Paraburkholderia silvatlantica]PYE20514.1 putative biosynthetic protein (TIGR04099 family) [Paraburkholderia silvatlantica]TDQ98620.1 putative biosynthetic protein (TIGR04099 family) [Parabur
MRARRDSERVSAQTRTHYIAGMPELAFAGLSEQWLLRTCGQLHWNALAAQAQLNTPDFYDDEGRKSYAAFTAIRVREARLEDVSENQRFAIEADVRRIAGARHFGQFRVFTTESVVANVEMMSTFVRREQAGDNRSVCKAMFAGAPAPATPAAAQELIAQAKRLRAGDWTQHGRLDRAAHAVEHGVDYLPCPSLDFNGAHLLYFASFQSMVERAEWHWRSAQHSAPPTLIGRDMVFYGNANVGDRLTLSFGARHAGHDGLSHWCTISRAADGVRIADVVTHKRWSHE